MEDNRIADKIREIIYMIGDNPERSGLIETPLRVESAYKEWFKGYREPDFEMKTFDSKYSGIITRKQIPFQSFCEHHMAIYTGFIDFGYMPNGNVLGISKIIRFFQHYSARLTIQEDLTDFLIDKFYNIVKPKGAVIIIRAFHTCEGSRGVRVPNVTTITSSVRGSFMEDSILNEFLSLIK
ncbi:MAG: GTP cyclohydrolase I FolE [bacterium]|nr:GTP cyclohydrolase I FolE [bacterium]